MAVIKTSITATNNNGKLLEVIKRRLSGLKGVRVSSENDNVLISNIGKIILNKRLKKFYLDDLEAFSDEYNLLSEEFAKDGMNLFVDENNEVFTFEREAIAFYHIKLSEDEENLECMESLCSTIEDGEGVCLTYSDRILCYLLEGKSKEDIDNILNR